MPAFAVLITDGLQVPVKEGLLVDVPGKTSGVSSLQYGPSGSNVGTIGASIVT